MYDSDDTEFGFTQTCESIKKTLDILKTGKHDVLKKIRFFVIDFTKSQVHIKYVTKMKKSVFFCLVVLGDVLHKNVVID
ncbi:unnamed protein product [Callosobruchus maculatus]|uniref:Uncharacterized protein n=1 Tax=Callosobruchus maculatus TaxID=64391 RepID=A0A653C2B8_CALMS|nr:unnamed protein product [Callosobruchus maculatus]